MISIDAHITAGRGPSRSTDAIYYAFHYIYHNEAAYKKRVIRARERTTSRVCFCTLSRTTRSLAVCAKPSVYTSNLLRSTKLTTLRTVVKERDKDRYAPERGRRPQTTTGRSRAVFSTELCSSVGSAGVAGRRCGRLGDEGCA